MSNDYSTAYIRQMWDRFRETKSIDELLLLLLAELKDSEGQKCLWLLTKLRGFLEEALMCSAKLKQLPEKDRLSLVNSENCFYHRPSENVVDELRSIDKYVSARWLNSVTGAQFGRIWRLYLSDLDD